jgi:phosphoglucomutase
MAPTPIAYGKSGWRGTLSEDFTYFNLRRATRAVARHLREEKRGGAPRILVGYDTRFLSEQLAREVAAVLLSEGVKARLASDFVPTPVVSHAVRRGRLDGAIRLTAGFEPSERQGFAFSPRDGAPASRQVTERIAELILRSQDGSPSPRLRPSELRPMDPSGPYRSSVLRFIHRPAIARSRLKLVCDCVHGAARGYLMDLLAPAARVTELRADRDVEFDGGAPDCGAKNLAQLSAEVRRSRAHLGLATDGDAGRFGIVDRGGEFVPPGFIQALLADYLLETRGYRTGIARTAAATRLLDDVAGLHGVPLLETPVGFPHLREPLLGRKVFLGADEDAGLALPQHLPEKDGILAACLVAEMTARRRTSLREQLRRLFRKTGPRHWGRREIRLEARDPGDAGDAGDVQGISRRLESPPSSLAGVRIRETRGSDGTLIIREDGSWILLRLSPEEPAAHAFAEARSPRDLARLLDAGSSLVQEAGRRQTMDR